jgi:competence protein ComEA
LLLVAIGGAVVLLLVGVVGFGSRVQVAPQAASAVDAAASSTVLQVTVHVSGEVARPGLATVPASARVADVIVAAGGATRRADLSSLNLAAPVRDAEHIHVPAWTAPASGSAAAAAGDEGGVRINDATAEELEALPGVGPVLAGRIAAFRDEFGPFLVVEDLLDVSGIGEGILARLRDSVVVP